RLGVGWSVVREINPRLVYASGSGYGLSGPDRDNLAMDLTIQAVSGLISTTGFPDGPPVKAGPAVVDFLSGIHLYAATVTALFERERTGVGRLVEVAMEEAAYATLTSPLQAYFETGKVPPRTGNSSHGRAPLAPVREVDEVMNDAHMHERGMLEWIEHDEIGPVVVPNSPLRYHGADKVETTPSPKLGQHNAEIYGGWLGLSAEEIGELTRDGV